jgi:hypothetical protein
MWMQTKNLQQNMVKKYSNGIDFHNGEVVGKQVGVALSKLTLIV